MNTLDVEPIDPAEFGFSGFRLLRELEFTEANYDQVMQRMKVLAAQYRERKS